MESKPQSKEQIHPGVRRSIHIGCQNYNLLKADLSNLTQCWNDAMNLRKFCIQNSFDKTKLLTDQGTKPGFFYQKIIDSFEQLISYSEGAAEAVNRPIYTFNFITFSGHGIMFENQNTLAIIPYQKDQDSEPEKKYINITDYAHRLAEIKNSINVILFDGCQTLVKKESLEIIEGEKDTSVGRSNENLLRALKDCCSGAQNGYSLIIYSSLSGKLAVEEQDGGRGTKKFLKIIEECQKQGQFSLEFIDYYEESLLKRISLQKKVDRKELILFPNLNIPSAEVQNQQDIRQMIENQNPPAQQNQQQQINQINQPLNYQEEEKQASINKLRLNVINHDGETFKNIHEHPLYLCDGDKKEQWDCQGEYKDQGCYGNVTMENSPMIQSHVCIIEYCTFRLCRSCFEIYCKESKVESIIGIPRTQNKDLYFPQWNKSRSREDLNTYYQEKKKWTTKIFKNSKDQIKLFWPKVIPLDSKYVFLIGGSSNLDFKTKTEQEPEHSIFLIDVPNCKIVERKRMLEYRHHCATALYKKKVDGEERNIRIIIAGGEIGGDWLKTCIIYNLETQEQKMSIKPFLVAVAGPSLIAIDDANLGMVLYLAGVDVKTNQSIIQKYSDSDKQWKIALSNYGHDFGFCSFSYCKSDQKLLLIGGIQIRQGLIYGDTTHQILKIDCESGNSDGASLKDNDDAPQKDYFYDNQVVTSLENPSVIYIMGKDHVYEVDTETLIGIPVDKGFNRSVFLTPGQTMP